MNIRDNQITGTIGAIELQKVRFFKCRAYRSSQKRMKEIGVYHGLFEKNAQGWNIYDDITTVCMLFVISLYGGFIIGILATRFVSWLLR